MKIFIFIMHQNNLIPRVHTIFLTVLLFSGIPCETVPDIISLAETRQYVESHP